MAVNVERLSKKYEINYDMARCLGPFFSTKFMEMVENHAELLMKEVGKENKEDLELYSEKENEG